LPILEKAKTDNNLYVKRAVAHILREASKKNPQFILALCKQWASLDNPNANWIIKEGVKKLSLSNRRTFCLSSGDHNKYDVSSQTEPRLTSKLASL